MPYIDVHCHLDLLKNIPEAVKLAKKENVGVIITNGIDLKTNRLALALHEAYPEVKAALGLYPIDALKLEREIIVREIEFIKKHKKEIAAIGEVGLDFQETEDRTEQTEIFTAMIELAQSIKKPLIVHSRKAESSCIELLQKMKADKVVMHCFSGKLALVDQIIKNGWSLSIPASVHYNEHFQAVVKRTPITQLLAETDAPFLSPQKGEENTPANVRYTYEQIAKIKGMSLREVERQLEKNVLKLFDDE